MNREELTKLFEKLGAREPENWASSQIERGINQLGRYLFLRQVWREVIAEDDRDWINAEIEWSKKNEGAPCSGIGPALERVLGKGAEAKDLTEIVRVMQYRLLFRICYLLSDPSIEEAELENFGWGLFQINDNGEVVGSIDCLHESLLEMDPTGREMRPRKDSDSHP